MRKIVIIFLFLISFPLINLIAQETVEQDRRIEEEKRQSLYSTQDIIPKEQEPIPKPSGSIDREYFNQLFQQRVAYCSDSAKILFVLIKPQDDYSDFDSQKTFLIENNIIPQAFRAHFQSNEPIRKGELAYMICKILNIKGGLWMRAFGISQRYAFKELVYLGVMPSGYDRDIISGKELTLILTAAANYISEEK